MLQADSGMPSEKRPVRLLDAMFSVNKIDILTYLFSQTFFIWCSGCKSGILPFINPQHYLSIWGFGRKMRVVCSYTHDLFIVFQKLGGIQAFHLQYHPINTFFMYFSLIVWVNCGCSFFTSSLKHPSPQYNLHNISFYDRIEPYISVNPSNTNNFYILF